MRKIIGLIAFFATGGGMLASAITSNSNSTIMIVVGMFSAFFLLGLSDHFKELI